MPWYKTGTVSVAQNSNAVIGTGTAFIANSRVGDGFRGPDGRWYEVTNIASNTALSISPNYEGPTVTDGFYSIMPVQGYQKDLSDQVRAILNDYGEKLAALGTTGNYDILPASKGGTGITDLSVFIEGLLNDADAPAARYTLGAAKSGANDDITSLTALTTAVPVAMGGTGGSSAVQARANLGLKSAALADVVGTMAAGDIIEDISNAGGRCVRFLDGTQICTYPSTGMFVDMTTAVGNMYSHAGDFAIPGAFPAPFIAQPTISYAYAQSAWYGFCTISSQQTANLWPNLKGFCVASVAGIAVYYSITAIGRWKA
ncbi:hypothetical protein PS718_01629 [Pseudomonas fluorescens]|uniref:Uncharacterized protein n=1 Tax=Pseudomonas fluorescens TaxID=294 RepID=A0A5E7B8L8_PSEFL|nr:phage tail protein [Pseudomonas fluorescens]VVN87719.1 hypothetical protein PS718_01629 [Pseudomonas fluorescens]